MILKILNLIPTLIIIGSVFVLTPFLSGVYYYYDFVFGYHPDASEVFDFIVIGGGSAGAVLANRLSKNNKVLLLEAGGDPVPHISIPLLAQEIMHLPTINWNHKTVPQKYSSQAMPEKRSTWPRGKLLGGTSNLNYMLYVRGHPLDYDNWANITGDDTWKYENVLPYFKKSLDYHGAFQDNEKHYGKSPYGYLHVESRNAPMHEYFSAAGKELNYGTFDLNGPQREGFGPIEVTQKNGRRAGTYASFIKDFVHRSNLKISRYSQATTIKFDKNNRAVGVWYLRHGRKYLAKVSKEIILSGGAVDSPKVLMLSGIGPKKHLESLKIKTRVDLPVGQNLKDHLVLMIYPFWINKSELCIIPTRDLGISALFNYFVHGKGSDGIKSGPFTSPAVMDSQAFITSKFSSKPDWPDLQFYLSAGGVYDEAANDLSRVLKIDKDKLDKFLKAQTERDAVGIIPTLVRPRSVGEITLQDKNPLTPPLIDPRYLEDPLDVKVLIEGIKFAIKIGEETETFKRLNTTLEDYKFPGCEHHKTRSDEYWECYIRQIACTIYHPVGTCRMGKSEGDPKAVVDSKLRVLKTKGLRIGDASIMPEIVNGNTNAPSILIGEMAADFIRTFWSEQYLICNHFEYLMNGKVKSEKKCSYSRMV